MHEEDRASAARAVDWEGLGAPPPVAGVEVSLLGTAPRIRYKLLAVACPVLLVHVQEHAEE